MIEIQSAQIDLTTIDSDRSDIFAGELPRYGVYDRDDYRRKLDRVFAAIGDEVTPGDVDTTYATAQAVFDRYEGVEEVPVASFTFMVPTRISRDGDVRYLNDFKNHLPVMKYLSRADAVSVTAGLPPSIIDAYPPNGTGKPGYLVFAPVFKDMETDLGQKAGFKLARRIANDAAHFSHERLGADLIGLGATLPGVTFYGREIRRELPDVLTTTGHGGTLHLIGETVDRVIEAKKYGEDVKIGVIGAGSIGEASVAMLLKKFPNSNIMTADIDLQQLAKLMANLAKDDDPKLREAVNRIIPTPRTRDVISRSDIIVSAITGFIDFDAEKWAFENGQEAPEMDLTGKVIIDDSQPGGFSREQVEARGGRLVWVVGADKSKEASITRMGGYCAGLALPSDVWGCEAETFSLIHTGQLDEAVRNKVSPAIAQKIGTLMAESGIEIAKFQSFGEPVEI